MNLQDITFKPSRFFVSNNETGMVFQIEDVGFSWLLRVEDDQLRREKKAQNMIFAGNMVDKSLWREIDAAAVIAHLIPDTPAAEYGEAW